MQKHFFFNVILFFLSWSDACSDCFPIHLFSPIHNCSCVFWFPRNLLGWSLRYTYINMILTTKPPPSGIYGRGLGLISNERIFIWTSLQSTYKSCSLKIYYINIIMFVEMKQWCQNDYMIFFYTTSSTSRIVDRVRIKIFH